MYAAPQPVPTPNVLIDWSFIPIPLRATGDRKAPRPQGWQDGWYFPEDWQPNEGIGLRCGLQTDGTFLYVADFDHKPEQGIDAPAHFEAALQRVPEPLRALLFTAYSTSRRGRYIAFKCDYHIPSTYLRDERGRKIGDFLGKGKQVVLPTPDRWLQGSLDTIPILDADDTRTLIRALNYRKPDTHAITTVDFTGLPAVAALLDARKLPARLSSTCPGARLLLGKEPAQDTSHARYIVIYDLVRHGYTDQETAALAVHLCDWGATQRKGLTWLEKDIERIIGKCRGAQAGTTHPPEAQPEQQALVNVEGGRPRKLTHEAYMLHLRNNSTDGRVLLSQAELAADLKVCKRTIQNWERELRTAGRLERHMFSDGKHSYLVLTNAITEEITHEETSDASGEGGTIGGLGRISNVIQRCDTREEFSPVENAAPCWACAGPAAFDPAGVLRCATCGEVPVVARLVEEALEAYPQRHGSRRVAAILTYVHDAGRPDAVLDWVTQLANELHQDRQQQTADAKMVAALRELPDKRLKAKLRGLESKQGDAHERGSPGQAWVFGRMAWFVQKEWERREPLRRVMGKYDKQTGMEGM